MSRRYALFVDLDGVLADFDRRVLELTGRSPSMQSPSHMWPILARTPGFYAELPWTPDGKRLWNYLRPYRPVVLTGLPRGTWARPQKLQWCRRELGPEVEVITCMSREKAEKARAWLHEHAEGQLPTPVLVDDRASLREQWEGMGGIFVHHTDARSTITRLNERVLKT
ncbi:MAG: hypothetical protein ACLFUX_04150 [Spirochaetaceae bacterium]